MRFIHDWQQNILRPIVVNLSTALILFGSALLFKDTIHNWFRPSPPTLSHYPLRCILDTYKRAPETSEIRADFFIFNPTNKDYSWSGLEEALKEVKDGGTLSPRIELRVQGNGRIVSASPDQEFNEDKGHLTVTPLGRAVEIRVENIKQLALLKASVVLDMPERVGEPLSRNAKSIRVFERRAAEYVEACYSR